MPIQSMTNSATLSTLLILIAAFLTSCARVTQSQADEVPLIPVELATQGDSVIPWRAPLRVRDTRLQMVQFDATGDRKLHSFDEMVFPIDLMIVYAAGDQSASVFLRRSPHGGCLLLWDQINLRLDDPCFGSRFDLTGRYISGPSPRDLDRLPASVRDGLIWVTPEIIYGEVHP